MVLVVEVVVSRSNRDYIADHVHYNVKRARIDEGRVDRGVRLAATLEVVKTGASESWTGDLARMHEHGQDRVNVPRWRVG